MTRREVLISSAAAALARPAFSAPAPALKMGGAPAGFPAHSRAARETGKPFDFVEYCHGLGFPSAETRLNTKDPEAAKALRQKAEQYGMYIILDIPLPREDKDLEAFDAALKSVTDAG